jgi:Flp pilus assembly protein TadG
MALVWVSLVGIVFIAFLGLAADTARVYLARHQLQNAADAAALAGAYRVRHDALTGGEPAAHRAAVTTASNNRVGGHASVGGGPVQLAGNVANVASGDVVVGTYSGGTFTPTLTSPNAVKVTARRTTGSPGGALPLLFAALAGVSSSDVSRSAIATIGGPSIDAGLILLNRHAASALHMNGSSGNIRVLNAGVQVNSDSTSAVTGNGHPTITAQALFVAGNNPGAGALLSGGVLSINAPPVQDPLAGLPTPAVPAAPVGNTSSVINPGLYNNNFPTNRNVKLNPGLYYIRGGMTVNGNRTIDARATAGQGVVLYFETGTIDMGGNSKLLINPPTSGPYAGVSIFQARGNTASPDFGGTNSDVSTGTFYFPNAAVRLHGNPGTFASQLIADTLQTNGNVDLNITYNGGFPIQGHKVWLVQ